jgi:flagellar hook assembly protein FlgD
VRRLDADADAAGWMELTWDGRDRTGRQAPSGMYLLRAAAAGRTQTERVLMVE